MIIYYYIVIIVFVIISAKLSAILFQQMRRRGFNVPRISGDGKHPLVSLSFVPRITKVMGEIKCRQAAVTRGGGCKDKASVTIYGLIKKNFFSDSKKSDCELDCCFSHSFF